MYERHGATVIANRTKDNPAYQTHVRWQNMRQRCNDPNSPDYKNYGGRGIKVCERWNSFSAFMDDMGAPPEGMTLDRIDVNGDYGPDNCRWVSRLVQGRNKRSNRHLTLNGETRCISEWAEHLGVAPRMIRVRLWRGWSVEDALNPEHRDTRFKPGKG